MERGKYIVIEGHDGTGKTTQVERLVQHLNSHDINAIDIAEPGATEIGYELRKIIKNGNLKRDPVTNLMLFSADRREMWIQKAEPALKLGIFVVSARNWFSGLAYQGYGEGLDIDLIKEVTKKFVGEQYSKPDLAILLSNDVHEERTNRIEDRSPESDVKDSFESRPDDFQHAVSLGYQIPVKVLCDDEIKVQGKTRDDIEMLIWKVVESKVLDSMN